MNKITNRVVQQTYTRELAENMAGVSGDDEIDDVFESVTRMLEDSCSCVAWFERQEDSSWTSWNVYVIPSKSANESVVSAAMQTIPHFIEDMEVYE